MSTVTYTHNSAYVGNRPYADVVILGRRGSNPAYKALVDTGADYLQLPVSHFRPVLRNLSQPQRVASP